MVDVLDGFGEPTGEVVWKSEAHRRGLWHRCFHCWVYGLPDGATGGEPRLLVQRRAAVKDTWPGRLDVTAAGHLKSGEGPLEGGLRELGEELGLGVGPERLVRVGRRRVELGIPGGRDREFHEVFLLFDRTPLADLRLQEEEVGAVLALGLEDAEDLGGTRPGYAVPAVEYVGGREVPVRVRLGEFVPGYGDYLRWVAGAVRRDLGAG